jgi:ribose 5-phosphate isomerase B
MTRKHNNSNILCMGERVLGVGLALDIVDTWLDTEYEGGRHQIRIDMLEEN